MSSKRLPKPLFDTLHALKNTELSPTIEAYIRELEIKLIKTDYLNTRCFLLSYDGSTDTFNTYRRELERYLQWCWLIAKKPISEITREDFESFIRFCQRPYKSWVGSKSVARYTPVNGLRIPNPEWRPFVANKDDFCMSQNALKIVFASISSFYQHLIIEGKTAINPVMLIKQKSKFIRKEQSSRIVRKLSELQWSYVIETAEFLAEKEPAHERTLFIMNCFFGMYLRVSELASSERWTPNMCDFYRDPDGNWWFRTVGKGNKQREISVSDEMLDALKRYRSHLNLSPLPSPDDHSPLIPKSIGSGPITSTRQIRKIVQGCFDYAVERMVKDGFKEDAELLKSATVHWLRHTGISEDVKHRPREHVRDDAGHTSSAITDRYVDVELRERHQSAKRKKINPNL